MFVPAKLTGTLQPLDLYFNRELKYLAKKMYGHAALYGNEDGRASRLVDRNNILKLQSLLHFILSAPVLQPMIEYSWILAGLLEKQVEHVNVYDVCFKFSETECQTNDCNQLAFINCSWCRTIICFHHFFQQYHVTKCVSGPYFGLDNVPNEEDDVEMDENIDDIMN